jgi:hypothetical protein
MLLVHAVAGIATGGTTTAVGAGSYAAKKAAEALSRKSVAEFIDDRTTDEYPVLAGGL